MHRRKLPGRRGRTLNNCRQILRNSFAPTYRILFKITFIRELSCVDIFPTQSPSFTYFSFLRLITKILPLSFYLAPVVRSYTFSSLLLVVTGERWNCIKWCLNVYYFNLSSFRCDTIHLLMHTVLELTIYSR